MCAPHFHRKTNFNWSLLVLTLARVHQLNNRFDVCVSPAGIAIGNFVTKVFANVVQKFDGFCFQPVSRKSVANV